MLPLILAELDASALLALALPLGVALAAIGSAMGLGRAVSTALESMGRQPEAAGAIQTAMIIGLALIESLVIYSLLIFFLLMGKLPQGDALQKMIEADAAKHTVAE